MLISKRRKIPSDQLRRLAYHAARTPYEHDGWDGQPIGYPALMPRNAKGDISLSDYLEDALRLWLRGGAEK